MRARGIALDFFVCPVHQEVKFLCRPLPPPPLLIGAHAYTQHGKLNFRVCDAIVLLSIKFNTTMKEGSERVRRDLGHARTHAPWETSTPVLDELIFLKGKITLFVSLEAKRC
jgi:hypothetical protein